MQCIAPGASKDARPGYLDSRAATGGPSSFEARRRGERLRMTVMECDLPQQHCERVEATSRRFTPEPCFRLAPLSEQRAQGRPGAGRAPTVHCAKVALQEAAQWHTGVARHPAFPAQWLYGLCRALPGERCTIAPVALRAIARLDAQTPGVRTTRFCRTRDRARRAARQSLA